MIKYNIQWYSNKERIAIPKGYQTKWVNGKQVRIHRYIMEQHLGRKLRKNELVHHVDGNKNNNSIENLELTTRQEHAKIHESYVASQFKQKYFISKEELTDLFVTKRISLRQISQLKNIPVGSLQRLRDKYRLKQEKVLCDVCGVEADYVKYRRCKICYLREYYRKSKERDNRR